MGAINHLRFRRKQFERFLQERYANADVLSYGSTEPPVAKGPYSTAYLAHEGAIAHKWDQYLDAYDALLAPVRYGIPGTDKPLRFLEIGVSHGGSLEVWRDYLGPDAIIHGLDIDPRCANAVAPEVATVHIGSQADPSMLRQVVAAMGGVDVVLDDGSHMAEHQRISFDTLWPMLTWNGLYMCEDVHTAYWPTYGGGYHRPGQFMSVTEQVIDGMHGWYAKLPPSELHRRGQHEVGAVHVYDSLVAFEKRRRQQPTWTVRGTGSLNDQGPEPS